MRARHLQLRGQRHLHQQQRQLQLRLLGGLHRRAPAKQCVARFLTSFRDALRSSNLFSMLKRHAAWHQRARPMCERLERYCGLQLLHTMPCCLAGQYQVPPRPAEPGLLGLGRNLGVAWARRQRARVRGGRSGRRSGGAVQRAGHARAAVLRRGLPRHRPRRHLRPHRRHRPQRADLREGGARVI